MGVGIVSALFQMTFALCKNWCGPWIQKQDVLSYRLDENRHLLTTNAEILLVEFNPTSHTSKMHPEPLGGGSFIKLIYKVKYTFATR